MLPYLFWKVILKNPPCLILPGEDCLEEPVVRVCYFVLIHIFILYAGYRYDKGNILVKKDWLYALSCMTEKDREQVSTGRKAGHSCKDGNL